MCKCPGVSGGMVRVGIERDITLVIFKRDIGISHFTLYMKIRTLVVFTQRDKERIRIFSKLYIMVIKVGIISSVILFRLVGSDTEQRVLVTKLNFYFQTINKQNMLNFLL